MGLSGCLAPARNPGVRTRAALYDAWAAWEGGRNAEALDAIRQALRFAPRENVAPAVLVEVYDDAGLYFHVNGLHEESVANQAVAVLLARKFGLPAAQQQLYEGRLRTALTAFDPALAQDVGTMETQRLLGLPGVRTNPHIRKYYRSWLA